MSRRPSARHPLRAQRHAAPFGELEGVAEQVLQDLLQPRGVGVDRARQGRREIDVECESFVRGHLPERLLHRVADVGEGDVAEGDVHHPRLDLRQIQYVIDQREQILPRLVNGLGEVDLLGVPG